MGATGIIFRREFRAYTRSPMGYIVAAVVLLLDGILFYSLALGPRAGESLSGEVLMRFFYNASGLTAVAAVALSIRLIAEERAAGTQLLLNTSPVRDWEIVLGKFLSALAFLSAITVATLYMPLLILVNGKIAFGHIVIGYVGLTLLGAAVLAIGLFATALTRHQLVAAASASVSLSVSRQTVAVRCGPAGRLAGNGSVSCPGASTAQPPLDSRTRILAICGCSRWVRNRPRSSTSM
jgi:ABC-2 type transport system permease protein